MGQESSTDWGCGTTTENVGGGSGGARGKRIWVTRLFEVEDGPGVSALATSTHGVVHIAAEEVVAAAGTFNVEAVFSIFRDLRGVGAEKGGGGGGVVSGRPRSGDKKFKGGSRSRAAGQRSPLSFALARTLMRCTPSSTPRYQAWSL